MNFLDSCRFCIQKLNKNERIEITFNHRSKFKDLTNTELINSEFYSEFSCYDCLQKLDSCLEVKNEFISKQDYLLNTCHQSVGGILQDQFLDTQDYSSNPNPIESVVKIEQDEYEIISIKEENEIKSEMLFPMDPFVKEEDDEPPSYNADVSRHSPTNSIEEEADITHPDVVECPYCFKLVLDLKKHRTKSHKDIIPKRNNKSLEKPSEIRMCHICGVIRSRTQLRKHIDKVHRKIKRYFCDYCPKSFNSKIEVAIHFSVHSLADPVQCAVCAKFYKSEKNLKIHMKAIHAEKTFICDFMANGVKCGKSYDIPAKLKKHYDNSHCWVKRHPCKRPSCQQSYSDVRDLEYHEYTVHLNMRIKCDLCPTLTTSKKDYKRHINLHHKELDENGSKSILDKITNTDHKSLFNYHLTDDDLKKSKKKKKKLNKK